MTDDVSLPTPPRDLLKLEDVIAAWQGATQRLEQTHSALRSEVQRLTDELAIKNRELARKNRLADLGQIASHVAHEVRNNLVPVSLYVGLLRRRLTQDHAGLEVVEKIESGMTALDAMVHDLLNFTADREPQRVSLLLRNLVQELLDSLAPQLAAQGIRTAVDVSPQLIIQADREALRRAVLNLVLNSLDAMPDGGGLTLTAVAGGGAVELEIADEGPGLTEEARRRAFEPFFTTKSSGIGLGLAIVHRLIESHGGDISVRNCPEGGAAFTICLPYRATQEAVA